MHVASPPSLQKDPFLAHRESLLDLAYQFFSRELTSHGELEKLLPRVKWHGLEGAAGGAFHLYLLCPSGRNRKTLIFCEELISNWLVPTERLSLLSSRNLVFQLPYWKRSLFFLELLIQVPDGKSLQVIQREITNIAEDIKLGTLSYGYAKHILEMKRLSFSTQASMIYETAMDLIGRFPRRFSHDIFREIQHFLTHCKKGFRQIRDVRHLLRIIYTKHLFEEAVLADTKLFSHSRHLYLKLMNTHLYYPFGLKKVLGITLSLNILQDYESFELRHILRAIERIIPGVSSLPDSYYCLRNEDQKLLTVYLEVEKKDQQEFTLIERKRLRKELPDELKNSVEYLSPSLFIPRNEEELIRNILQLSNEIRYVKDLPQTIISFQEQRGGVLRFDIVLLRVLGSEDLSLSKLSRKLPLKVRFVPERVANVGFIRKKYVKEANVFVLETEVAPFIRKNHSVDLVKAREYIVKVLEEMLGPFRDYNGGFLLKQKEQLERVKHRMGEKGKLHAFWLDKLFYSLTPSTIQTYVPPKKGELLFSLFLEMLELPIASQKEFLIRSDKREGVFVVIVKATHPELREQLIERVQKLEIDPLQLGISTVEIDKHLYLCFLYLDPTEEQIRSFAEATAETLDSWSTKRDQIQMLRLHLPRAAQSLDPRIGSDRTSGTVIRMLYEGLTRLSDKGEVELAIAKSVTLSSDQRTYKFTLKETVWSNETPLTAYDFEYAWKKILEPDFLFLFSFLFFPIKHAEAVKRGEVPIQQVGIRALDANTLLIELEQPLPSFLELTASWVYSPLCREIDQKHPGWAYHSGETYVCNGPFKLDLWKLNDDLQLVNNPRYWDAESVKIDRIQVSIIENEKMALELFAQGKLDWVGDPLSKIPPSKIPKLQAKHPIHVNSKCFGHYWLQMNLDRPPFQSVNMRKAFSYAIDRRCLVEKIMRSQYEVASGFSIYPEANPKMRLMDHKKALHLFDKGLEEMGLSKRDLPPLVITHSDIEEQEEISLELGRQWKTLFGIEVKYERVLWNSYFETLNRGDFLIGGIVWYPRHSDPLYYYDRFVFKDHSVRVTNWKNRDYSKLIDRAKRISDAEEKQRILEQAEVLLRSEMPIIPLFYQNFRYIKNPRLQGYILSNTNQIDFRTAYLEINKEL